MNSHLIKPWIASITLLQSLTTMALDEIPIAYLLVAKSYQIPADILYAIALTESGKRYQDEKRPWPWALNIAGDSVYCDSRQDAMIKVTQAIRHKQSVDIGLMQINWHWHWQRFSELDDALVPMNNLKVGAAILHEQFEQTNDWWLAVGRYHDPGQDPISLDRAEGYRQRVRQNRLEIFQ